MPWHIAPSSKCPASKPYAVIKDADGSVAGCHPSKAQAKKHMAALYANEPQAGGSAMLSAPPVNESGCDDCQKERRARAQRLRSLARFLRDAPVRGGAYAQADRESIVGRFQLLARQQDQAADNDWDEDPGHLAQAVDAVLDEALEAFQGGETDQGVALAVAAAATVDELLEAMGVDDADEGGAEPAEGGGMGRSNALLDLVARAVDNSAWDGSAAMGSCAGKPNPGSCYRQICAGRKAGDPSKQSSWALPHHKSAGGPPNASGVRAALAALGGARGGVKGLTNAAAAKAHLNAHMRQIQGGQSSSSDDHDHSGHELRRVDLYRAIRPGYELRWGSPDDMPTLVTRFAVYDQWTEIESLFEGRFLERLKKGCMTRTFEEDRSAMRVLFQHGRDPYIGQKPLGPIEVLEEQRAGSYAEVPLLDTTYNRDLLPALERGLYGASFRFQVTGESWNQKPERSDYNPDGLPERTVTEVSVMEFGPVTFAAYAGATAGVRSITDEFTDPDLLHHMRSDVTGRPGAGSAGGGEHLDRRPGNGAGSHSLSSAQQLRQRTLRILGVI